MHLDADYLYAVLSNSPPGYREFQNYLGSSFWIGRRQQMNEFLTLTPRSSSNEPLEQVIELVDLDAYSLGHRVPIFLRIPPGHAQRIFPRF